MSEMNDSRNAYQTSVARIIDHVAYLEKEIEELRGALRDASSPVEAPVVADEQGRMMQIMPYTFYSAPTGTVPGAEDVTPGEAWIVDVYGELRTAVKDNDSALQWSTVGPDGKFHSKSNEEVSLVSRLVRAPRVITNPEELRKLATRAVILSTDRQADVYQKDNNGEWRDVTGFGFSSRQVINMETAVTVLWEPSGLMGDQQ